MHEIVQVCPHRVAMLQKYHLYNVNIEKDCQCNYLVNIFNVPHKYACICGGHFCSHCRSMCLYVGFIIKLEVVVC